MLILGTMNGIHCVFLLRTCIRTNITTCNILYKEENNMYFSLKCKKDVLTHQHGFLPRQCVVNRYTIHISLTEALPFSSQSPPALFIFKGLKSFIQFCIDLNRSLQTFPKNWQLLSPPLTEGLSFWLHCFSFTGYFQFFDFMPYLPSPIKIQGKTTKRQAYNFKQSLKQRADRGWR